MPAPPSAPLEILKPVLVSPLPEGDQPPTPTPTQNALQLVARQGLNEEDYPDCTDVDSYVWTCYPVADSVIYQNQYTRLIWNSRYVEFFTDDGDGTVDLYLRNDDNDEFHGNFTAHRAAGVFKLPVDDTWWDKRAVDDWDGQPRNWTFYWTILPHGRPVDGTEPRQTTFTVIQTALPNFASSSSAAVSQISESLASISRSIQSEEQAASESSSRNSLQDTHNSSDDFPAWAIALIVVFGVVSLISILALVFIIQRHMRHRRKVERRTSMGSESPMMAAAGEPMSPTLGSTYGAHPSILPPPVRPAPSLRHDGASTHSRNTAGEGVISGSDAAIMADAFRKALRKPDFTDRPQEEGESPEAHAEQTEAQLLKSELADEGRNIRSVSSERGVRVVSDEDVR